MNIRETVAKTIRHDNPRCVAPPGDIIDSPGVPILVSTQMRTGTHLLIDAILNNFPAYRSKPLYVNIDEWYAQNKDPQKLFTAGSIILKTHYPQLSSPNHNPTELKELAKKSHIFRMVRDKEKIYRSRKNFYSLSSLSDFEQEITEYENFWHGIQVFEFNFEDIINKSKFPSIVEKISDCIQQPVPKKIIYPPDVNSTFTVLSMKLATRLFGANSPRINTTIRFAQTKKQ